MRLPKHIQRNVDLVAKRGHSVVSSGGAVFRCTRCPANNFFDVPLTGLFTKQCTSVLVGEALVKEAIGYLRAARDVLKDAHCPKTVARVRLALSSAKGAARNAMYRRMGVERGRKMIKRAPKLQVTVQR
jgi:hypothetical protein